jgi:hypothetical protein
MVRRTHETAATSAPEQWRTFLRGLALELDTQIDADTRASILRATGHQMARMLGLSVVSSLEALEMEMGAVLAYIGWGSVQLSLDEVERCVVFNHSDLPRIGSAGEPSGTWLAPVLEGLYQGWMSQQPGAETSFNARIMENDGLTIVLRYGR